MTDKETEEIMLAAAAFYDDRELLKSEALKGIPDANKEGKSAFIKLCVLMVRTDRSKNHLNFVAKFIIV